MRDRIKTIKSLETHTLTADVLIQGRVGREMGNEEQSQLLAAISGLLNTKHPLLSISAYRRRVDEGPENGSVTLAHVNAKWQTQKLDFTLLSQHQRAQADVVITQGWRLIEILAASWPAYAPPEVITIFSDGRSIAFCSSAPMTHIIILENEITGDPLNFLVLLPRGAPLSRHLSPLVHGAPRASITIQ